jgi:hypothetical protein
MTSRVTWLVLGATVISMAGCGGGSTTLSDETSPDPASVAIRVENNHFADAQIFIQFEGQSRRRLGTVTGKSTSAFTVRHTQAPFRVIVAYTGGGATQRTESVSARPGEEFMIRAQERRPLILIRR